MVRTKKSTRKTTYTKAKGPQRSAPLKKEVQRAAAFDTTSPTIKMTEYAKRRKALMEQVGDKSIVIIPGGIEYYRNGDATYAFRQNSDFYYLSGFAEPDAILVLAPNYEKGEYILFTRVRDRDREIWDGKRAGLEGACQDFLADVAYPFNEFSNRLPELLAGRDAIHYPVGLYSHFDQLMLQALNQIRAKARGGFQPPSQLVDINPSLHEMRLFKSPAEIAVMQHAVDITGEGHLRAIEVCRPGMYEYELEAELAYAFIKNGARSSAYNSIVGAGRNSCTLHYIENNARIENGDLVLIDAGAEYQYYAADITRTFPANGRFTSEQKAIYELVLAAQQAAIETIKPGAAFLDAQHVIVEVITQGLIELDILKGNLSALVERQAYLPFYMHRSGHWLGLDVHDVGRYRINDKWRSLQAGMTLTIEPGIYISSDVPGVHPRWHNIGVRIEDDVLVTATGVDILSNRIPKTVDAIETIMTR